MRRSRLSELTEPQDSSTTVETRDTQDNPPEEEREDHTETITEDMITEMVDTEMEEEEDKLREEEIPDRRRDTMDQSSRETEFPHILRIKLSEKKNNRPFKFISLFLK